MVSARCMLRCQYSVIVTTFPLFRRHCVPIRRRRTPFNGMCVLKNYLLTIIPMGSAGVTLTDPCDRPRSDSH